MKLTVKKLQAEVICDMTVAPSMNQHQDKEKLLIV